MTAVYTRGIRTIRDSQSRVDSTRLAGRFDLTHDLGHFCWLIGTTNTGYSKSFVPPRPLTYLLLLDDILRIRGYNRIYSGYNKVNHFWIWALSALTQDGLHTACVALAQHDDVGLWHFAPVLAHRGLQLFHVAVTDPTGSGCIVPPDAKVERVDVGAREGEQYPLGQN